MGNFKLYISVMVRCQLLAILYVPSLYTSHILAILYDDHHYIQVGCCNVLLFIQSVILNLILYVFSSTTNDSLFLEIVTDD